MAFRSWFISFFVFVLFFLNCTRIFCEDFSDSTLYLEGMSSEKLQEISMDGFGAFRSKASITDFTQIKNQFYVDLYSHLKIFHQDILYSDKIIENLNSVKIYYGSFSAGIGRGAVNIAKGFLIGNQFMRFTSNPSQNFRISNFKMKTKNYDYYKKLKHISYAGEKLRLSFANYNDIYISSGEFLNNDDIYGMAVYYEKEDPYFEYWIQMEKDISKFNFNLSHSFNHLNHINIGLLQEFGKLKFNTSVTKINSNYKSFDKDTKWGSYLDSEGIGFVNGLDYTYSYNLRLRSVYIYANETDAFSRKWINEMRLRFEQIHFLISYQIKDQDILEETEYFPHLLSYTDQTEDVLKIRADYEYSKCLNLQWSNYYSPADKFSFLTYFRLKYKKSKYYILAQYSYGEKKTSNIYFTRPLYYPNYLIQRLIGNSSYLDFNFGYYLGSAIFNFLYKTDFTDYEISCQIQIDLKK